MEYDENGIKKLYKDNLKAARKLLASLPVAEGREPNTKGLSGWIYEQTIRYCLSQELMTLGLCPVMEEQIPLYGRTKIDLLVGRVAVEIKALGSFGDDARKYSKYRAKVEERGWVYFLFDRKRDLRTLSIRDGIRIWERAYFLLGQRRRLGEICDRSSKIYWGKALTINSSRPLTAAADL